MIQEIRQLIRAFGYQIDFEDESQGKERYSSEIGFIDLWNGRKGITIGIYNPHTKSMKYFKRPTLEEIEGIIEKL